MAIIRAYAEQGIRLPLVLDDVLVNFDLDRAKAAAVVLRDFARQGHQVFIFTCHEHIAELFKTLRAQVRQLPSSMVVKPDYSRGEPAPPAEVERAQDMPEEPLPEPVLPLERAPLVLQAVALPAEEPPAAVLIEPPVLRAEPVTEPEPVPPRRRVRQRAPKSAPPTRRRRHIDVQTVRWSAEEFEGELADRVAHGVNWVELPGPEKVFERDSLAVARSDDHALLEEFEEDAG